MVTKLYYWKCQDARKRTLADGHMRAEDETDAMRRLFALEPEGLRTGLKAVATERYTFHVGGACVTFFGDDLEAVAAAGKMSDVCSSRGGTHLRDDPSTAKCLPNWHFTRDAAHARSAARRQAAKAVLGPGSWDYYRAKSARNRRIAAFDARPAWHSHSQHAILCGPCADSLNRPRTNGARCERCGELA